ncbi:acyltransferase domain-containing protein [Amycolatopsis rubida]|uniref:Acyltransferase domain-containing protein n=1 Tax=Amycolatopsis rubida TaxID=112413 RepID=A0ABX0C1G0_9PSEU|nr:acyltransferase domain-containing protein [Amycolatopsis sp. M39]MYW93793.1 acyltransferase domain-containing protein [Amycolatopsis rubida]NEC58783.1 acyltransferase domain-containing protein [Amycolatopsis rubida]OAP22982.1 Erythronolide synthase, modules 1 and 2 [Amycolatopsis sp. M39]
MTADISQVPRDGTVFLFPGQGIDPSGALRTVFDGTNRHLPTNPSTVDATIDEIGEISASHGYSHGSALRDLLLGERTLEQVPYGTSTLAQFAASVSVFRLLADADVIPDAIVAMSLGEAAALACAGSFDLAEATRLVCLLNDTYRKAVGRGTMVLVHADEETTRDLLSRTSQVSLVIASVNTPAQVVVTGPSEAVTKLMALPGPLRTPLPVPYQAHTPALRPLRDEFLHRAAGTARRAPRIPVCSAARQRCYACDDDPVEGIADNFVTPVNIVTVLKPLAPAGSRRFFEIGAGGSLTRCAAEVLPGAHTTAPLVSGSATRRAR